MKSKKIIISLGIIGVVTAIVIGGTIAYFNDTETSTGNILVAGSLDLKVDHIAQSYNGVDCKTCSVTVISDVTNMVVEKNEIPLTPYPAVFAWTHSAWTAQNDPELIAANAKWIWEDNPTKQEDTQVDVTYTFEKNFEWWGPIVSTDLYMAVGSDNSVEVYLNGTLIGSNYGEYGYKQESMLHILAEDITPYIVQGNNVLEFIVKNWALAGSDPYSNPAGLIYKFSIDGNCGDDYFRNHCKLWGEKDLGENDRFFDFDDIKPGDRGTNVISLHLIDNDGWACLLVNDKHDDDNGLTDPEETAGDTTGGNDEGELSENINVFLWMDDGDGIYDPNNEEELYSGSLADDPTIMTIADSTTGNPLEGCTTEYVGLAWCAGTQTVNGTTGEITCDGQGMNDMAQTDSLTASLTIYAEQWRNNPGFDCANVQLPN